MKEEFSNKVDCLNRDEISRLVAARESFVVTGIGKDGMSEAVDWVEAEIERQGFKVRVYLKGRNLGMLAGLASGVVGVASAVAIGAHNLATFDPDYEIAKNKVTNELEVAFVRGDAVVESALESVKSTVDVVKDMLVRKEQG